MKLSSFNRSSSATEAGLPGNPSGNVNSLERVAKEDRERCRVLHSLHHRELVSLFVDDEEGCAVVVPEHYDDVIAVLDAVFDRRVPVLSAR